MEEKEKIEEGRQRKLHKGQIQKNTKDQTPNPYEKQKEDYSKRN
jgi:hypothetical protein